MTDLDTLVTALYVKIDDELAGSTRLGRPPKLTDAEVVTLAVAQALLGINSEARWLRVADTRLAGAFSVPADPLAYNRRLRRAEPVIRRVIRVVASDTSSGSIHSRSAHGCGHHATSPGLTGPEAALDHQSSRQRTGVEWEWSACSPAGGTDKI